MCICIEISEVRGEKTPKVLNSFKAEPDVGFFSISLWLVKSLGSIREPLCSCWESVLIH